VLLDKLDDRMFASPGSQFERAAVKCVLLEKLRVLLLNKDRVKGNERAIQWAASRVNLADVEQALPKAMADARTRLASLRELSSFQENLKSQLDAIGKTTIAKGNDPSLTPLPSVQKFQP
jgi:hypothetical protein